MSYFILPKIASLLDLNNLKLKLRNAKNENYEKNEGEIFINYSVSKTLKECKKDIHNCIEEWDNIKKITNPFEFIHTIIPDCKTSVSKKLPLSRSYFKMIEICKTLDLTFSNKPSINSFHLAEGPGGFIEALVDMRKNAKDSYYGMTLQSYESSVPGWKKSSQFLEKYKDKVIIENGKDRMGNLYNPENFSYCHDKYANTMNVITGDGGFDFSNNYNLQEDDAIRLIYTEVCYAIMLQKFHGHFILKMFDIFLKSSVDILYLLSHLYEDVYIFKPNTSRYANSEKYIVCKDFRLINSHSISRIFYNHLQELNKHDDSKFITEFFNKEYYTIYKNSIIEINTILGQQQMENINLTIVLIKQLKKKDKIETLKKQHINNATEWCKKYEIEYHDKITTNNIFL
uniref:Ribosomal RNA methyltransferase FtsJ domain-containing protein n=1 Tax=viral metagenome TaxID=1070528 RepID=A0A6C0KE58_9ZZZZ